MEPTFSRDAFLLAMRQRVEEMLGKVADAVNEAVPGKIINGSEEKVRLLGVDTPEVVEADVAQADQRGERLELDPRRVGVGLLRERVDPGSRRDDDEPAAAARPAEIRDDRSAPEPVAPRGRVPCVARGDGRHRRQVHRQQVQR